MNKELYKIILIGDSQTGKSTFFSNISNIPYYNLNINACNFKIINIYVLRTYSI